MQLKGSHGVCKHTARCCCTCFQTWAHRQTLHETADSACADKPALDMAVHLGQVQAFIFQSGIRLCEPLT